MLRSSSWCDKSRTDVLCLANMQMPLSSEGKGPMVFEVTADTCALGFCTVEAAALGADPTSIRLACTSFHEREGQRS